MTIDQLLWLTSRAAALTAFFVLGASLLTGQALRTALFGGIVRNRELLNLHRFLTVCWLPLVALHIVAVTIDGVARIRLIDLMVPFRVSYAPIAVGMGTLGFDVMLIVMVTSYLRQRLDAAAWRWLHRLSYLMFGLFALHALLAGTDVSRAVVLVPVAGLLAFIGILTVARLAFGRLDSAAS